MALRYFWVGSVGPFMVDTDDTYDDGEPMQPFRVKDEDGSLTLSSSTFSFTDTPNDRIYVLTIRPDSVWIEKFVLSTYTPGGLNVAESKYRILGNGFDGLSDVSGSNNRTVQLVFDDAEGGISFVLDNVDDNSSIVLSIPDGGEPSVKLIRDVGAGDRTIELAIKNDGTPELRVDGVAVVLGFSVIDAKGDLIVGTGDNAVDNLAVGTNGDYLTPDSGGGGGTMGVKWQTPGPASGLVPKNGALLGNDQTVETDGSGNLITAAKGTAYNKDFGTGAADVAVGNHRHLHVLSDLGMTADAAYNAAQIQDIIDKIDEIIATG